MEYVKLIVVCSFEHKMEYYYYFNYKDHLDPG